ncbi:helix-turn-helix domain-containing protein [Pedobacter mucosus]|uniref:helix-turn-helix domain-containing protein n=1 Tax=Pedobacter mucosus TaxID=2895286 RepID=UPI00349E4941
MLRTAKQLAARLGIHTTNLNHYLKSDSGKTTTEHINLRIITEAKHLLLQSNYSISEITYALSFEQLSHFSTF